MYQKKEIIAMLLAGGQGKRLGALTMDMAKPAVHFGGKYRMIDFSLSNCINSGIDTVGVVTQYQPHVLHDYIGTGQPWDLDRLYGGVHMLPPYQTAKGAQWYEGTSNAVYQNMEFIEKYNVDYVIVLSGDHVYKMDYSKMLEYHKNKNASVTIASVNVDYDDAKRFGTIIKDAENKVKYFEEKPEMPKSTLVSMGVYIFNIDILKKYLELIENDDNAPKDFGKAVIPAMLENDELVYTYEFSGYWRDIGTIDNLWEANMDLLNPKLPIDLYSKAWRIYSRNSFLPPHCVSENGTVDNSLITEGCYIEGLVDFSVIYTSVVIEKGAEIHDSIIMPNTVIKAGAVLNYAIVGENCVIGSNCRIGERPENIEDKNNWGLTVIGHSLNISDDKIIGSNEMIYENI